MTGWARGGRPPRRAAMQAYTPSIAKGIGLMRTSLTASISRLEESATELENAHAAREPREVGLSLIVASRAFGQAEALVHSLASLGVSGLDRPQELLRLAAATRRLRACGLLVGDWLVMERPA